MQLRESFPSLVAVAVSAAIEIHLSPIGDDANPGTPAQPVATPQRAQELVRVLIAAGLTGSVIHHSDRENVSTTGTWKQQTATGMWGLFEFNFLTGNAATPSEATYLLPITEDGIYQVCLLYRPGANRASNVLGHDQAPQRPRVEEPDNCHCRT